MRITLRDLQEKVGQDRGFWREPAIVDSKWPDPSIRQRVVDEIVKATVECLGFHVNARGEVCDPRPATSNVPRQHNVRWTGGRRKR